MYVCRAMDVTKLYGIANKSRTSRKPCDTIACVHHVVSMYLGGRNRIPSNGTALRTRWGHPSGEPSSTHLQRTASAGGPNEIKTSATRPIAVARSQMLMSFSNAAAKVSAQLLLLLMLRLQLLLLPFRLQPQPWRVCRAVSMAAYRQHHPHVFSSCWD